MLNFDSLPKSANTYFCDVCKKDTFHKQLKEGVLKGISICTEPEHDKFKKGM